MNMTKEDEVIKAVFNTYSFHVNDPSGIELGKTNPMYDYEAMRLAFKLRNPDYAICVIEKLACTINSRVHMRWSVLATIPKYTEHTAIVPIIYRKEE